MYEKLDPQPNPHGVRPDPFEETDPWMDTRYAQNCGSFSGEAQWAASFVMKTATATRGTSKAAGSSDPPTWHADQYQWGEAEQQQQQAKKKKEGKQS